MLQRFVDAASVEADRACASLSGDKQRRGVRVRARRRMARPRTCCGG
jgi:hypothetical protein